MKRSWKISYFIIGILFVMMIISIIPWGDSMNKGPKIGVVEKVTISDVQRHQARQNGHVWT